MFLEFRSSRTSRPRTTHGLLGNIALLASTTVVALSLYGCGGMSDDTATALAPLAASSAASTAEVPAQKASTPVVAQTAGKVVLDATSEKLGTGYRNLDSTLLARVYDIYGNPMSNVPISFRATGLIITGLSETQTNSEGVATTTVSSSQDKHNRTAVATASVAISTEPLQTSTSTPSFQTTVSQVDYRIKPVFDYDISGLVVSKHNADTWWDWIHKAWNDELNVVDLCMIWGVNAADGAYRNMSFSSGQFVCYFQTSSRDAAQPKYFRALSNNHLLTDDPGVARELRHVRIGDQIHIRGQLAEYAHDAGFAFTRGTSTSRDDTGNGACETIFVRDVTVLRSAAAWPRWLFRFGLLGGLICLGLWFAIPHRARDA